MPVEKRIGRAMPLDYNDTPTRPVQVDAELLPEDNSEVSVLPLLLPYKYYPLSTSLFTTS